MYSLDFEEFLWAKGYRDEQIEDMYRHMLEVSTRSESPDRVAAQFGDSSFLL